CTGNPKNTSSPICINDDDPIPNNPDKSPVDSPTPKAVIQNFIPTGTFWAPFRSQYIPMVVNNRRANNKADKNSILAVSHASLSSGIAGEICDPKKAPAAPKIPEAIPTGKNRFFCLK